MLTFRSCKYQKQFPLYIVVEQPEPHPRTSTNMYKQCLSLCALYIFNHCRVACVPYIFNHCSSSCVPYIYLINSCCIDMYLYYVTCQLTLCDLPEICYNMLNLHYFSITYLHTHLARNVLNFILGTVSHATYFFYASKSQTKFYFIELYFSRHAS